MTEIVVLIMNQTATLLRNINYEKKKVTKKNIEGAQPVLNIHIHGPGRQSGNHEDIILQKKENRIKVPPGEDAAAIEYVPKVQRVGCNVHK